MRPGSLAAIGPIAVATVVASAFALSPASQQAATATTELDQEQTVVDQFFCMQPYNGSACYAGGAQTVTAGVSGELFAVELHLARQNFTTTTKDLVVQIRDGGPSGTLLATSDPVPATNIPILPAAGWVLITFPTPPTITAGDLFAIVVPALPLSDSTDPAWGWGKAATDVYAGGATWGGNTVGAWDEYVDGSDLAFATYVRTGPPICDMAVATVGGDLVDSELTVSAGQEFEVYGFDFPANANVSLEFDPMTLPGPLPPPPSEFYTVTTDAFGDFFDTFAFDSADIGQWNLMASRNTVDTPNCVDAVTLRVAAAAAASPSAAATVPPAAATPAPAAATPPPAAVASTPSPRATLVAAKAVNAAERYLPNTSVDPEQLPPALLGASVIVALISVGAAIVAGTGRRARS